MAKVVPTNDERTAGKVAKFHSTEEALSSRYKSSGIKVDGKEDKDRYVERNAAMN